MFSILAWKVDRQILFDKIDNKLNNIIKNIYLVQILYILATAIISFVLVLLLHKEIFNAITAFLVIDISSTERKNLTLKEKLDFYNTITTITRANICGFIAPLLFIGLFGNIFAIIYSLLYNCSFNKRYKLCIKLWTILTIVPSLIYQLFLYIICLARTREVHIDYKGEYLRNLFLNPILNANILAAYVESVNFYYYFKIKDTDYIKCYGKHSRTIQKSNIKSYLGITYFISIIYFLMFFIGFTVTRTY